jgi:hypothetical protein
MTKARGTVFCYIYQQASPLYNAHRRLPQQQLCGADSRSGGGHPHVGPITGGSSTDTVVQLRAIALAGWEPTTGGLRVDLLFGCPLLLETRVID